jgi:transposase
MMKGLPKRINDSLSESQLSEIEQAIKSHADLRVRERARIIRLLHKGHPPPEVAELLAVSVGQVYWWSKRWQAEGLAGFADKPRSGRPIIGTAAVRAQVEQLLETDPKTLGYGFTVWTAGRLLRHLREKLSLEMHKHTLRNLLDTLGFVYRRPKHDLTSLQDGAAKADAQTILNDLKKRPKVKKSNYSLWTKQP